MAVDALYHLSHPWRVSEPPLRRTTDHGRLGDKPQQRPGLIEYFVHSLVGNIIHRMRGYLV